MGWGPTKSGEYLRCLDRKNGRDSLVSLTSGVSVAIVCGVLLWKIVYNVSIGTLWIYD